MKTFSCFFFFGALLSSFVLLPLVGAAGAGDFASPSNCTDVCAGYFLFHNLSEARECCNRTRKFYGTNAPTAAPANQTTKTNIISDCRSLTDDKSGSFWVTVLYSDTNSFPDDQECTLCVGATIEGNACSGAASIGIWIVLLGSVVAVTVATLSSF